MKLVEVSNEVDERLQLLESDYKDDIPQMIEVYKVAKACIDAQYRLIDLLEDLQDGRIDLDHDRFSAKAVLEMLNEVRYDWVDEDA